MFLSWLTVPALSSSTFIVVNNPQKLNKKKTRLKLVPAALTVSKSTLRFSFLFIFGGGRPLDMFKVNFKQVKFEEIFDYISQIRTQ